MKAQSLIYSIVGLGDFFCRLSSLRFACCSMMLKALCGCLLRATLNAKYYFHVENRSLVPRMLSIYPASCWLVWQPRASCKH